MSVNNAALNGSKHLKGIDIISVLSQRERKLIPFLFSLSLADRSIYADG